MTTKSKTRKRGEARGTKPAPPSPSQIMEAVIAEAYRRHMEGEIDMTPIFGPRDQKSEGKHP